MDLSNKPKSPHLLVGVTGSVAAIRIFALVSKLIQTGFDVRVITTKCGLEFFDPSKLDVPVYTDENEWSTWNKRGDPVLHIELRNWADLLLLAPLSANSMAKMAYGLADNLLVTLTRAWWFRSDNTSAQSKPVYFAPAMNTLMWEHPFTMQHLNCLKQNLGWKCIEPICKTLVCGEHGLGAMAEVDDIVNYLKSDYWDKVQ